MPAKPYLKPGDDLRELWGTRIAGLREHRGLTQLELANAVGVTQQAVAAWEAGETGARPHLQQAIARALNTEWSEIFAPEPS